MKKALNFCEDGAFFVSSGNVTSTFTLDKTEFLVCYQISHIFAGNIGAISVSYCAYTLPPEPSERLECLLYEQKIDSLAQQLEREKQFNKELLLRLDSEAEERRKLTLLLTHHQEQFFNRTETVEAKK